VPSAAGVPPHSASALARSAPLTSSTCSGPAVSATRPTSTRLVSSQLERVAREAFGFEALRRGQREATEAVLEDRDTLAVMTTGSGKSAIHQIAGLLKPGATVVVSP